MFNEGDIFTLNGSKGIVYEGRIKMKDSLENPKFQKFMAIADRHRTMGVRTNADTPEDAATALKFGAQGIGLFRTEHMFYGADSDQPLFLLRKMILSKSTEDAGMLWMNCFHLSNRKFKIRWMSWTTCR